MITYYNYLCKEAIQINIQRVIFILKYCPASFSECIGMNVISLFASDFIYSPELLAFHWHLIVLKHLSSAGLIQTSRLHLIVMH